MSKTALERHYIRRRRRGKMLAPVRTAPTVEHPLGRPVKVSTRYREPNPPGRQLWSRGYHPGADFACPEGSQAVATKRGTVKWVGTEGGWSATPAPGKPWAYGLHVIVETGDGELDYGHCHLSRALVKVGDSVIPGTLLGLTGSTGNTTGAHDHVEVRPKGGRFGSDLPPVLIRRRPRR